MENSQDTNNENTKNEYENNTYKKHDKDVRYIDPESIADARYCQNGTLTVVMKDGETMTGIKARRLFPLSKKRQYIVFLDSKGEEIGIIKQLSLLDRSSKLNVLEALEYYYHIPKILQIDKIDDKYGIFKWYVITDKGEREFEIINTSTDIKSLGGGHYVIKDIDDNRYEIKDINKLDKPSRFLLEEQL
jgi:hypothetical protein